MPFSNKFKAPPIETSDVYRDWQAKPTPELASGLLKALDPTIHKAISAHVGSSNPLLYSRARGMALQAAKSYDSSKGASLETHVMQQLQGLKRVSRQQSQVLRTPERVSLDQAHLQRSENELNEMLHREPTDQELADHAGLSLHRITRVRAYRPALAEGVLNRGQDGEENDYNPAVNQAPTGAWRELVYHELPTSHQKVMEHTLGMHGRRPLSNLEIAKRLRVTPGRISQIKNDIQKLLDQVPAGFDNA